MHQTCTGTRKKNFIRKINHYNRRSEHWRRTKKNGNKTERSSPHHHHQWPFLLLSSTSLVYSSETRSSSTSTPPIPPSDTRRYQTDNKFSCFVSSIFSDRREINLMQQDHHQHTERHSLSHTHKQKIICASLRWGEKTKKGTHQKKN